MAAYPATLPPPLQSGYVITPDDPLLRTSMSAGADRVRRQTTAAPSRISVLWRLSAAELALFEAWHSVQLLDGALWFDCDLANGMGFSTMQARFTKPVRKSALVGMAWELAAELEVRQPPRLEAAYLEVALAYAPDELVYASAIFNTLVTQTLPIKGF